MAERPVPHFAREDLASVRASGVESLLHCHYLEIAHFKDIPLAIDWDAYELAEKMGKLRIFTARVKDELVGYAAYLVNRNPHYMTSVQALQDVLYLSPEQRGLMIGSALVAYADVMMKAEGVQATYQHAKIKHPLDAIFRRNGYEPVDTLWAKRLDRTER